jgi:hypothetical protein
VVPQKIDTINCYICAPGTDGCGPSFKKTGAGVISTSDSSAVYCTVCICECSRKISTYFLYRKKYITATPMLFYAAMAIQEPVLSLIQQPVSLPPINIVVQRICATALQWER